jgi:hypothetical protein
LFLADAEQFAAHPNASADVQIDRVRTTAFGFFAHSFHLQRLFAQNDTTATSA